MNGLGFINIELTSRCNKVCSMCGRRKLERDYPDKVNWGDMPYEMVEEIATQIPKGIVVQFHNNGEPLMYPHLGAALSLFRSNIRCFNTNAKLLVEKADEVIGNLETLTISVVEGDEEGDEQYGIVRRFLERKGSRKPNIIYRLLGNVDNSVLWERLGGTIARRVLHSPEGSFDYTKRVTIPEIGICLDLLGHLAIDRFGNVSHCVRLDPNGYGILGKVSDGLANIWNGDLRKSIIQKHLRGERNQVPLCATCDYFGCPTSP